MAAGETEAAVKYETQLRKAEANEARKRSAQAVVDTVAAAPAGRTPAPHASAEAQIGKGSANQQYSQKVKAATQKILAELPGIEGHSPLPFRLGGEATGV